MFSHSKKRFIRLLAFLAMHLAVAAIALDQSTVDGSGTAIEGSLTARSAQRVDQGVDSKHILVSQAQRWVAENRQLPRSVVEVAPSDRRLIIPACDSPFEFNYPFATSLKTLRASCRASDWQIFLGINIYQPENALRYTGNLKAGHQLLKSDVELVSLPSSIPGLATDMLAIEGNSLNSAVRAGDLVMQRQLSISIEGYRLTRSILAGETLDSSAVETVLIASGNLPESQKLSADRLNGARAARDLAAGKLLSSYDIKEKHQLLVTQTGIARGQAVTQTNVAIQDYYGKPPQDSLRDYSSAKQMQAIRNLPVGSLVRLSDLTPVDIIRKGDNVQLTMRAGALEITVTMLALENARRNQRVLLLNPESGDEVQAIATAIGRARGLGTAAEQP
jgi:flagella basal body P-ring formation protein FlgA